MSSSSATPTPAFSSPSAAAVAGAAAGAAATANQVGDEGLHPPMDGADAGDGTEAKPKKKICCACPESKRARDECVVMYGEPACKQLIEAHKRCLREEGFNV